MCVLGGGGGVMWGGGYVPTLGHLKAHFVHNLVTCATTQKV